jgi:hypothetical protein
MSYSAERHSVIRVRAAYRDSRHEAGLSIPSRTPLPPPRRPSTTQAGFGATRRAKAAEAREAEAWEQSLCTRGFGCGATVRRPYVRGPHHVRMRTGWTCDPHQHPRVDEGPHDNRAVV